MKFYIAASLSEVALVRSVSNALRQHGWIHTYDWTLCCDDADLNDETMRELAEHEYNGVKDADIVLVLNPKGRGTHVELGLALAFEKTVYLYHQNDAFFRSLSDTVSFYWLPQLHTLSGNLETALGRILEENPL